MTLLPTPLEEAAKKLDPDAFAVDEFGSYALVSGSSRRASARTHATAAIAAYLTQAGKEGWVMVPLNPNYDMGEAGMGKFASFHDEHPAACVDEIYRAMIAAAQNGGE